MAFSRRLSTKSGRRTPGIGRRALLLLLMLLAAAGGVGGYVLFETENPAGVINNAPDFLGSNSDITITVSDGKAGLKNIKLVLEQNGTEKLLLTREFERRQWFYKAGPDKFDATVTVDIRKHKFKDGPAELVLTVHDFSLNNMFKGNRSVTRLPVTIDTRPPRIVLQHSQRYIRPGGTGIVVYDLSEDAARHGVMVNDIFFKGFPLFGRDNRFVAYIALAWDTESLQGSTVVARDQAGNESKALFSMVLKKKRKKTDRINVSDGFLNNKIPEFEQFYPEMSGSMLDKYLFVNNEIRKRNAETIRKICSTSEPDQLWRDRFLRMPGASRAGFADQRTYYYQNRPVDHQVHLGMDIASTAAVDIKAANRGKVVFADYLGIYGNTVIIDHGQGVFSLYSHLSRIETTPDVIVDQGTVIGYSGATGMAGGDHLHFSILINGIFVTPVEWWDQQWIDVNLKDVLSQL